MNKMKFIIIGLGNRGVGCFAKGLMGMPEKGLPEFKDHAEIVAFVDTNLERGRTCAKECGLDELPVFKSIEECKGMDADWCIVTTPDHTHKDVVCAALRAGLNVLVDKPLATSVWECKIIMACMEETGQEVIVGHNMRYGHNVYNAKKLIKEGSIGKVISAEGVEVLDYSHGGDYFHRWHSDFSKSAGMLTHKCCHYLDILNWIVDDVPVEVAAIGGRDYYVDRPDLDNAERCRDCNIKKECNHAFDMNIWDGIYKRMYQDTEHVDGYIRDLCVFSDRHTVLDNENLNITYKTGIKANFSLVTFGPTEFNAFTFNGTKGRLEVGTNSYDKEPYLRIIRGKGDIEEIEVIKGSGTHGHGGADIRLIAHILGLEEVDPLVRAYPQEALNAVAVADMAARSYVKGGVPVSIEETGNDFPPAPITRNELNKG